MEIFEKFFMQRQDLQEVIELCRENIFQKSGKTLSLPEWNQLTDFFYAVRRC